MKKKRIFIGLLAGIIFIGFSIFVGRSISNSLDEKKNDAIADEIRTHVLMLT